MISKSTSKPDVPYCYKSNCFTIVVQFYGCAVLGVGIWLHVSEDIGSYSDVTPDENYFSLMNNFSFFMHYYLQLLGCAVLGVGIWLHVSEEIESYSDITPDENYFSVFNNFKMYALFYCSYWGALC